MKWVLRIVASISIAGLYFIACALPVVKTHITTGFFYTRHEAEANVPGILALLFGWIPDPAAFPTTVPWSANFLLLAGLAFLLAGRDRRAAGFGALATLLGLTTPLCRIEGIYSGYFWWLASLGTLFLGAAVSLLADAMSGGWETSPGSGAGGPRWRRGLCLLVLGVAAAAPGVASFGLLPSWLFRVAGPGAADRPADPVLDLVPPALAAAAWGLGGAVWWGCERDRALVRAGLVDPAGCGPTGDALHFVILALALPPAGLVVGYFLLTNLPTPHAGVIVPGLLFVAIGFSSAIAGACGWEWFMNHRQARPLVSRLGWTGARVAFVLLGFAFIAGGAWVLGLG